MGEERINIDYTYCGIEPGSTQVLVVFGVDNLTKASETLDELAAQKAITSLEHQIRTTRNEIDTLSQAQRLSASSRDPSAFAALSLFGAPSAPSSTTTACR